MEMKFYICKHCGNIIMKVKDVGVPVMCCGEKMTEIIPGTTDAAVEKHVPVFEQNGNLVTVKIGAVAHPMTEPHWIDWVAIKTNQGIQIKELAHTDAPEAHFALVDGEVVEQVEAHCNLHGLWKA